MSDETTAEASRDADEEAAGRSRFAEGDAVAFYAAAAALALPPAAIIRVLSSDRVLLPLSPSSSFITPPQHFKLSTSKFRSSNKKCNALK